MKIIATDLDGTLFYPKEKKKMIYEPNLYLLQNFADKGGKIVLISGRSNEYLKKVCKKINRNCATISYNGACISENGKKLVDKAIPNLEAIDIIDDVYSTFHNFGVFLMTDQGIFVHLRTKSRILRKFATFYYGCQKIYAEKFCGDESKYQECLKSGNIYKIMFFFGLGKKGAHRAMEANKIVRNAYENIESSWSSTVIEVTYKGCSKATAIKEYLEKTGLNDEELYVVGDSGNDISMFKAFHERSFCLAHAPLSVKKYAKYTIEKFEDLSRYIY